MIKVFINPGHDPSLLKGTSEYDCGAWNPRLGIYENEVAAAIGQRVSKYLADAGCDVRLYQSDSLADIVNKSDAWGADLFVSIHCNAFNEIARGTETYAYYNSGKGKRLAECINNQIVDSIDITDRGAKTAGYYVIRYTDAIAVLVETAFIDNDEDGQMLIDREDDFARAIARGVTDYIVEAGL